MAGYLEEQTGVKNLKSKKSNKLILFIAVKYIHGLNFVGSRIGIFF